MSPKVVVKVRLGAEGGTRGVYIPARAHLDKVAPAFGGPHEPANPGASDPQLKAYFTLTVANPTTAQGAAEAFRQIQGVEAAYTKPLTALSRASSDPRKDTKGGGR